MDKEKELIEQWEKEVYNKNIPDFNILHSIHLGENDHTNILQQIFLNKVNGKRLFLESFIEEYLGITDFCEDYNKLDVKVQVAAIGANEKGFIDLLIEDTTGEKVIIIENKVCYAPDGDYQLQRYWCTYAKDASNYNEEFKHSYEEFNFNKNYDSKYIYIVYLTLDNDKKPSKRTVNEGLSNQWDEWKTYKPL